MLDTDPIEANAAADAIAQSTTNRTDDSLSGDGKPSEGAPATGQGEPSPGDGDQKNAKQPPEGQAAEEKPEVKDTDLDKFLADTLGATPEKTEEQLRRDFAASSKEARRLKDTLGAVQKALKEQGINAGFKKDGTFAGLLAVAVNEEGALRSPPSAPSYESLSQDERDLAVSDSEAFIKAVWQKAHAAYEKHFARPHATVAEVLDPPSPETLEAVKQSMRSAESNGEKVYPELDKLNPRIDAMLSGLPDGLRDAYYKHPEIVRVLLYDRVAMASQRLLAWAEKQLAEKKEKARANEEHARVSPGGVGTVTIGSGSKASDAMAELIAKAR